MNTVVLILSSAAGGAILNIIGNIFMKERDWGIEKKREKLKERKKLVNEAMEMMTLDMIEIRKSPTYNKLMAHVSKKTMVEIYKLLEPLVEFVENIDDDPIKLIAEGEYKKEEKQRHYKIKLLLRREVYRLQKEWEII